MKKIIAIHRPLGADLQPLIFRIPRAVFQLFYLQPCLQRAGERGQVWTMKDGLGKASTQSNLAED